MGFFEEHLYNKKINLQHFDDTLLFATSLKDIKLNDLRVHMSEEELRDIPHKNGLKSQLSQILGA